MNTRPRLRHDDGLTMIELLVVILIGALVTTAITAALIAALKTQDATADRLAASHDTQLVATWLPFDTASAAITGWDIQSNTTNPCATSTGTNVMKLPFANDGVNNIPQVVAYRLEQDGATRDLVRYQCNPNTPLAFSRVALAKTLRNTSDAAVAAISCTSSPNCTSRISITLLIHLSTGQDVTYDGDGRTGTTLAALGTTTTTGSSTTTSSTTTTSTSTTTTTQPCTVTSVSLSPSSVGRATNGSNADELANDVAVSANATNCTGVTLSIQYTRKYGGSSFLTTQGMSSSGSPRSATIQGANQGQKFDTGQYVITVTGASNSMNATLTVT